MSVSSANRGLKPGVCTSTTRPSNPFTGQIVFETDTGFLRVWDGSAWDYLSQSQDTNTYLNNGGLVYITQASWVTGSTVSVNNCFTSTYSAYRLVIRNAKHATTAVNLLFRLRASGSDANTNYYWSRRFIPWGGAGGGDTGGSADTKIVPGIVAHTSAPGGGTIDVIDPQKNGITSVNYQGTWTQTTGESSAGSGMLNDSVSYDGFSLVANTGNLTALQVFVYGYREA